MWQNVERFSVNSVWLYTVLYSIWAPEFHREACCDLDFNHVKPRDRSDSMEWQVPPPLQAEVAPGSASSHMLLLPQKMSGNPRWRASMSEVTEKCMRPWGGTNVHCIIDKDRRRQDLLPIQLFGLNRNLFSLFLKVLYPFFCSPSLYHLPIFSSFGMFETFLNPSQVFRAHHCPIFHIIKQICAACLSCLSGEVVRESNVSSWFCLMSAYRHRKAKFSW